MTGHRRASNGTSPGDGMRLVVATILLLAVLVIRIATM